MKKSQHINGKEIYEIYSNDLKKMKLGLKKMLKEI